MFTPTLPVCLSYMHDLEKSAAVLIIIFSETIFVIILLEICVAHYIFHCRKYSDDRNIYNDTVRVNISLILFGNEICNTETNIVFFSAVHRYIHVSKRF